jgi:hypothetical protein
VRGLGERLISVAAGPRRHLQRMSSWSWRSVWTRGCLPARWRRSSRSRTCARLNAPPITPDRDRDRRLNTSLQACVRRGTLAL